MSKSIEETKQGAQEILSKLPLDQNEAVVFSLSGNLGSGKTAFAKEFGSLLGIKKEEITSPTFVIEKIYAISHLFFSHFIHIDAYRLESAEELLHLGWEEIVKNKKNIIFIEWGERVSKILPPSAKTIQFRFIDEETREITFENIV